MPDIKTTLADLAKQIDATLNPPAAIAMTAEEFTAYAKEQLAKAAGEKGEALKARVEALKAAVAKATETFKDGTEKIEVVKFADPVTEPAPVQPAAPVAPTAPVVEPVAPAAPVTDVDKSADAPVYWPSDLNDPAFRKTLDKK
jgi:hypothetical protein